MSDHRFGRRWRRAIARSTTRLRHADRHEGNLGHIGHADRLGGDYLPESSHLRRGLR